MSPRTENPSTPDGAPSMFRRSARDYFLMAFAILFAAMCVRLGFWQLQRLHQRRALNALVSARLSDPPVQLASLPRDTGAMHFRRVVVNGTYDYEHQVTVADRTRNGSPGVNVFTPVRIAGTDTVLLVNRGWLYAPDGITADLRPWHEADSVAAVGYVRPLGFPMAGSPELRNRPGVYRWLDPVALRQSIPYPVYPFVVVLEGSTGHQAGVPPRVPPPPLDEGPHKSYALQWFSFAAIAIFGSLLYMRVTPARRNDDDDDNDVIPTEL